MSDGRMDLDRPAVGETLEGAACLVRKDARETKDGKPYLVVEFRNATGSIQGRLWSEQIHLLDGIEVGRGCQVEGIAKEGFRGGPPEITISSIWALPHKHSMEREINPISRTSQTHLLTDYHGLVASIGRPALRDLLEGVIETAGGVTQYMAAPAATPPGHHGCVHGLLEHSCQVARIARSVARERAWEELIDLDLLTVASLLHDVGKTAEYQHEGVPIARTAYGRLMPHTTTGPMMLHRTVERECLLELDGLSEADIRHIEHIMSSHHGKPEWGSPVPPATLTAEIVHYADLASSRVESFAATIAAHPVDEDGWILSPGWPHRRPIWVPERAPAQADPQGREDGSGEEAGATSKDAITSVVPRVDWSAPLRHLGVQLEQEEIAYLAWLVDRDVAGWDESRRCSLRQDDAAGLRDRLRARLPDAQRERLEEIARSDRSNGRG